MRIHRTIKSFASLLLIINFVHGVSNAEVFTPAQEPLIMDLRPKPNMMLVMDTSKAGVDSMLDLTKDEQNYFEDELTTMGLQNNSSISKTQAISVALLKLLKTYQHIAHFGLARIGEASPYAYITESEKDFYKKNIDKTVNVNPIIHAINTDYNGAEKEYVGSYSKLHANEKQHLNTLQNSIANFQQQYSTNYSTRAWNYGMSELNKYFWGSRYYLDKWNKNFDKDNPRHIANLVLPLDIDKKITGEARIEYEKYEDPIRFICQQSHILYFPVEKSGAYDYEENYDRIINVPVTFTQYYVNNSYANMDKEDNKLDGIYSLSPTRQNEVIATLLNLYMPNGNINDDYMVNRSYCHLFGGRYGLMRSLVKTNGNGLADLHNNLWPSWSGSQCSNGAGAFEPSDLHTSAIYVGDAFSMSSNKWNEKMWSGTDYLQTFIQASTRKYADMDGTATENSNVNGMPYKPKATSVYLRANRNQAPTLLSIYQRSKEYLDKVIVSYKSNGHFIMDQHMAEQTSPSEYIGYSSNYTEQFWTSELRAYDPRKPLDSGGYPTGSDFFADVYVKPTWTTTEKIAYDQGKFFTYNRITHIEQKLTSDSIGSFATIDHVKWLKGDLNLPSDKFRIRNVMLGDIINSSIVYEARDFFHINLDLVGNRPLYIDYMYKKRENFENNLLIAGSNDGFINFIIAGRNSKDKDGIDIAGTRKASYFVSFFKSQIAQIVEPLPWYGGDFKHQYRVDGQINISDAIVNNGFKTTGIAGMGAGHKGLASFELFSIDDKGYVDNKGEVKALFEIDDTTMGFGNLGFTYSGFSFFNIPENNGRSIAVFGNGPGSKYNKSSLFFIDAITGDLIGEINLSDDGGGAFTPALVLAKDEMGQKIEKIYVGDYSGKLFKVDFKGTSGDLSNRIDNAKVTVFFDAANGVVGRPISTKPYVIQNANSKKNWIYFGTGMLATEEQKDSNVIQSFFGIEDKEDKYENSIDYKTLNELSLKQLSHGAYSGLQSAGLGHELYIEVKGARDLKDNENGWVIPLSLELDKRIIPKSFGSAYQQKPSINVIHPAALLMKNKIMFSAMEVFDSKMNNVCASDVVQTLVFVLNTSSGAPLFQGLLNVGNNSKLVGGHILVNQGVLAPFRTFGTLTQDSYVDNIESGYNISLSEEEREFLDDVDVISAIAIRNSDSSNIGGRRKAKYGSDRYVIDRTKYHFLFDDTSSYDYEQQKTITNDFYDYLPFSSGFGEEGSSKGYPLGSFIKDPVVVPKSRRLSIQKKF